MISGMLGTERTQIAHQGEDIHAGYKSDSVSNKPISGHVCYIITNLKAWFYIKTFSFIYGATAPDSVLCLQHRSHVLTQMKFAIFDLICYSGSLI